MKGFESPQGSEAMHEGVDLFIETLSKKTGEELEVEDVDGTYEIEADNFSLTFTLGDEFFEIRSIDVRGNTGFGSRIITAVHDFADEQGLEVIASNVVPTATGFWQTMGYQEGSNPGEFYR